MASREHKIVRRADAMNQLGLLSTLLAERFNIEPVNTQVTNKDPELAEIQRIENINGLLAQLVEAGKTEPEPVKKPVKKHATVQ